MDYKKKYEELVGKIEKAYLFAQTDSTKAVLEEIRPILKESEDEKIRKELIELIGCMHAADPRKKVWITWLEKQGEKEADQRYKYLEDLLAADDIYQMAMNEAMVEEAKTKAINALSKLEIGKLLGLEKQGEQKPTLPKWRYKKDNTPLLRDSLILNKYGCVVKSPSGALVSDVWVIDYDELAKLPKEEFEKQGEQPQGKTALEAIKEEKVDNQNCVKPANKVEPKFHEGDIIKPKDGGHEPWQIIQVDISDKKYRLKDGYVIHFSQEDDYELVKQKPAWSEEDEKNLQGILDEIEANKSEAPEYDIDTYNRFIDWLKSLKDRVGCEANCTTTWKPSEEQLECLYDAIEHYQTNGYPASKLNELYEQMSKIYKL